MLILIHVISALASVALATILFFAPSSFKFRLSYGMVGSTIASGTLLVIANHSHLLQTCTTGLVYICGVSAALALARYRYQKQIS